MAGIMSGSDWTALLLSAWQTGVSTGPDANEQKSAIVTLTKLLP